jgi:hypothetical protein
MSVKKSGKRNWLGNQMHGIIGPVFVHFGWFLK